MDTQEFLQEFKEFRIEKVYNNKNMSDDNIVELRKQQHGLNKKYPDAEEFFYDDMDIEQGHCPYCHKDMEFDISGDLWDYETGLVEYPAIGIGRSYQSIDYWHGYNDNTVDMYFQCPHCGKIFYVEV